MGKVPVRLKEVVYMVSPFEVRTCPEKAVYGVGHARIWNSAGLSVVSILNGLWKDFPQKVQKNLNEKGWNIAAWCVAPTAAVMWYAEDYREKEKMEHRF